jgi:hypothetical protein
MAHDELNRLPDQESSAARTTARYIDTISAGAPGTRTIQLDLEGEPGIPLSCPPPVSERRKGGECNDDPIKTL